jgi:hypothetical protein
MKKRPILNAYEMKIFKEWIADGNAVETEKGVWLEQTTQYRVKFTYEELQNYFKKEYLTYKNGGSAKDLLSSKASKVAKKEKSLNLKAYNVPIVPYAINPLNEGLDEIFQDIVDKDEVRERMNGVNFVENTATGTDAQKLLHLVGKREGKFKDGNYYLFSTMENEWSKDKILSKKMSVAEYYKQRSLIEEIFPNWIRVVYDSFEYKQEFNLPTLYDVVNSLLESKLLNRKTSQEEITADTDEIELEETNAIIIELNTKDGAYQIGFNAKIFRSVIKSLMMAGITDATGYFNTPFTGVTILDSSLKFPNKNKRDEFFMENSFGLVMPIMLPDEETLEEIRKEGLRMAEFDNLVYEFPVIRVISPNEYEIEIYGQDTLTYSRGKGIKIGTKSTTKSTPKSTPKETPKATSKTTDKKTALGNKLRKGMVVRIEYKESNGSTLSYDLFYDNGDFIEYVLIINKKGEELVEAEEIITEKELNEKYTELSEFIVAEFYETKEDGGELMASGGQMKLFVGGGRAIRPTLYSVYKVKDKMGRVMYLNDNELQKFINDWNEDYFTDYEDWVEFNEYEMEFVITPVFSKNEMGGDVDFVETQINDIANWENEEIASYLEIPVNEVANNREEYIEEAQNSMLVNQVDGDYAMGGIIGNEVDFMYYGEPRKGKIIEDFGDSYGVQSGSSQIAVDKADVLRTIAPKKETSFRFFDNGGGVGEFPPKGELTNKDNFLLKYEKKGGEYEFFVYKPITKEVSGYNQIKHVCLNKDCPQKMTYEQFINYLYAELYLDDTKYADGGRTMENRAKKQARKDIKTHLYRPQAPYQSVQKPSEEWERYELPYDTKMQYDFEPDSFSVENKRYLEYAKGGEADFGMGGRMNVVLASSPTLEGIKKLISEYLYGSTITLVQIDDDGEFFEVHNKKGITPFYVKLKNNKYQFVPSQDNYSRGGTLDKKYNFNDFGIKSYRELIDRNEFVSKFKSINNSADFNRIKYNRMRGEEQLKYVQRLNKQVNKYNLTLRDSSFYEVSKEIFDYADIPETETKNYYTKFDEPSGYIWKNGGSLKKKSNDLGEYYEKYSNGGFVGGDIIKFKYDGKDFTRKVESVDEMGNAVVNLMKSEKATINPADIFDIKKEFTEKDVIIKKIGLSEENADFLISLSPTFAVWLADSIIQLSTNSNLYGTKNETIEALNKSPYLITQLRERIRGILDWLQHPSTPKQNLRELTFAEAEKKSEEWHEELSTSGGDIDYTEPKENIILKKYAPNEFGITYYWVFIPKSKCDIEGKRMGHCGTTSASSLISLRSVRAYTESSTITDSHVTVAYDLQDGKFYQGKAKKNAKPSQKYFPYIFDLIKSILNDEINERFRKENDESIKVIEYLINEQEKIRQEILQHINFNFGGASSTESKFLEGKLSLDESTKYLRRDSPIYDNFRTIYKLNEKLNEVRNNRDYEEIQNEIERLREEEKTYLKENIFDKYKELGSLGKLIKEAENVLMYFKFDGFGCEYKCENDYGWGDMTNKQIKELYELKPELFNDFASQYMLYKIGLVDEEPNTKVTIEKPVGYVADLLSVDRDLSDNFVEKVLTGETYDFLSSDIYVYYYDNAGDYVDDLNKEDYDAVLDKIVEITGLDKEIVEENGAKHYLVGDDEEFDSETFEDIKRAIASALEGTEISSYQNYYFDTIKEALGELGVIKNLDDTGVEIEVDLKDLIGISAIIGYIKNLNSENLEDVFFEAESNGDFSLPDLSIDDRYSGDTYGWQEYFDINNYAVGGAVYPDLSMQK